MIVKSHFITLLFLLFNVFSFAQTQKELQKMTYDELKDAFFQNENKINKQKIFVKEFVKRAKSENNQSKLARGYYYYSLLNKGNEKIVFFDSIINNTTIPISDKNFPIVAFIEKGYELENLSKFEEAIECYLQAEKLSLKRNIDYYYVCKYIISNLKSEKMGEIQESMPLLYDCYSYYKKKKNDPKYYIDYQNMLFALADNYKSLNISDSASYYNKLGYIESKKNKNKDLHFLFILNEGANQLLKKNYKATIDSINIALPEIKKMNNINNNILASYYYYGKAYEGLKNIEKAVENFGKVDSIYQKNKIITPEFTDGYGYLIEYYKKNGDTEKQLYYINTLMQIDSVLQKNYKVLSQKLKKEYDIPHLMQEKERIISSLKTDKKNNFWIIGVLIILSFGFLGFIAYQTKQKRKLKERFDAFMIRTNESINIAIDTSKEVAKQKKDKSISISNEVIEDIKAKLIGFENEKSYLDASIALNTMAENFNTNTKYLSVIINETYSKTFTQYVNDLRIDYIINELKQNKTLQKYTINGIAQEAGFNTGESFSNAFSKRTGLKPSYFIKKLNELNGTEN